MRIEQISNNSKFSVLDNKQFSSIRGGQTGGGKVRIETIRHFDQNNNFEGTTTKWRSWTSDDGQGCYFGEEFYASYDPAC